MTFRLATRAPGEREDVEVERLVRPAPKKKPPRHDRRRERVSPDIDPDTEGDADLKTAARVLARYAAKGDRVPAKSKETGRRVWISEESLRDNPDKYEEWKDDESEAVSSPGGAGAPPGDAPPAEKPKPPRPPRRKKKSPDGSDPAETPSGEAAAPGTVGPPSEAAPEHPAPTVKPESAPEGDTPPGAPEHEKPPKKAKPKPSVAEKLGIQPPQRREATEEEKAEASLLLADHLPPELAAQLIGSGLHPDDAKALVDSYQAAKSRPIGNPAAFAEKAAKIYETNPDRVEPPKTWRTAEGKKVAFDDLSPEERSAAYRQHQMEVVAVSLAAKDQLEKKLAFDGALDKPVASLLARTLLGSLTKEQTPKVAQKVFDETAASKGFTKIPEGTARKMIAAIGENEQARTVLQSYLEANDYKRAKDLYLGSLSEHDKPSRIVEGLTSARHFFKVQGRVYGTGEGHEGAKRFETKILGQLRDLNPQKYKTVRLGLDQEDAAAYRKAKRKFDKNKESFDRAHEKWAKKPFGSPEPQPPEEPAEPLGYSNTRSPEELQQAGRQLWEDLHSRTATTKMAARVASKFLISTYLTGMPMARTPDSHPKRALYHGIDPAVHYPTEPYPSWGPVPTRDLSELDYDDLITSAREWFISTVGTEGMVPDQRFRQALDLALATGPYRVDVQTYNDLLARLQGVPVPGLDAPGLFTKHATDRAQLERAIFAKFPADSKRRAGGKPMVMLTGDAASSLHKADYSMVVLADLSLPQLQTLAKTLRTVTSSFAPAPGAPDSQSFRKTDNGVRPMLRLSSEQKASANQILANFDHLAQSIQDNYKTWGMPREAAKRLVNHLDRTADATEAFIFGETSLQARQAEIAVASESFAKDAVDSGLISRSQFSRAARVLQRDSDEQYMDTYKNPMAPIETDSDEPYMAAYGDDQSSAVESGEDDTGRELAPGA